MRIKILLAILLLFVPLTAFSRAKLQGWAQQGNTTLTITGGIGNITRKVQGSYPGSTVTVYDNGTVNLSTIYSDNSGTLKANPFTASSDGSWYFYADDGRYDVRFSGTGITTPFTISDLIAQDSTSGLQNLMMNVQSFGAVADGTTDNSTAIQDAITWNVAHQGACIYFPSGRYAFSTTIDLTNKAGLCITGEGMSGANFGTPVTMLKWTGANNSIAIDASGLSWSVIKDIGFDSGTATGVTGWKALGNPTYDNATDVSFYNVWFNKFQYSMELGDKTLVHDQAQVDAYRFFDCTFTYPNDGIGLGIYSQNALIIDIYSSHFRNSGGTGSHGTSKAIYATSGGFRTFGSNGYANKYDIYLQCAKGSIFDYFYHPIMLYGWHSEASETVVYVAVPTTADNNRHKHQLDIIGMSIWNPDQNHRAIDLNNSDFDYIFEGIRLDWGGGITLPDPPYTLYSNGVTFSNTGGGGYSTGNWYTQADVVTKPIFSPSYLPYDAATNTYSINENLILYNASDVATGTLTMGTNASFQGIIHYDNDGVLYLDNTWDSTSSDIVLRSRVNGTPVEGFRFDATNNKAIVPSVLMINGASGMQLGVNGTVFEPKSSDGSTYRAVRALQFRVPTTTEDFQFVPFGADGFIGFSSSGDYLQFDTAAGKTTALKPFNVSALIPVLSITDTTTGNIASFNSSGDTPYINFTSTMGASGYGIRDNAGAVEFKDSGGAWTALSSGYTNTVVVKGSAGANCNLVFVSGKLTTTTCP